MDFRITRGGIMMGVDYEYGEDLPEPDTDYWPARGLFPDHKPEEARL